MPVAPKAVFTKILNDVIQLVEVQDKIIQENQAAFTAESAKRPGMFSGPSQTKLQRLSATGGTMAREYQNLKKLQADLSTLSANLSDDRDTAISQLREVMIKNYIDEYAQGRGADKKTSQLLTQIEEIILHATENYDDNFFMKNEAYSLKKGTGHEHFDSRFLAMQFQIVDPELPNVVEHLFRRVLGTVLVSSEPNQISYTNYMKALVRVGLEVSATHWNDLIETHLGKTNSETIQLTLADVRKSSQKFTENNIKDSYGVLGYNIHLIVKVRAYLGPESAPPSPKGPEVKSPRDTLFAHSVTPHSAPPSPKAPAHGTPGDAPPLLSEIQPQRPKSPK